MELANLHDSLSHYFTTGFSIIPGDEPSAANIRHISNTWQLGEFSLLAWAPEQQPAPRLGKFQECCKSPAVLRIWHPFEQNRWKKHRCQMGKRINATCWGFCKLAIWYWKLVLLFQASKKRPRGSVWVFKFLGIYYGMGYGWLGMLNFTQ